MDVFQLIHFIVRYATERGSELPRMRLVKFLYLADLFHARVEEGITLSGWQWEFVHYGPYCRDSTDLIDSAVSQGLIDSRTLPSKFREEDEYHLYRCPTDLESEIERELPVYVASQLKWAIRNWADDTASLLDYVYFNTEPMLNAARGDLLDFSTARVPERPTPIEMVQLPRENIEKAKESVRKLIDHYKNNTDRMREVTETAIYDEHFFDFTQLIEGEDLGTGATGTARLGHLDDDLET